LVGELKHCCVPDLGRHPEAFNPVLKEVDFTAPAPAAEAA
jgi:hypothetical protein